ncbi:hypothetical protein DVH24_010392 [Malus domestica]|uniref:Myb-like domain-containing protein n=1 Tax=Malus domestica TaxID=3750 RepID=A0A498JSZ4_MALDO|nr:hypothetical protein DVH24_010392 [Malus domestica]
MKDGSQNKLDVTTLKSLTDSQHSQPSQIDAQETPIDVVSERSDVVADREPLASSVLECPPCAATTKTENELSSVQMNGYNNLNRESKSVPHEGQISSAALCPKGLDSESSCTQTSLGLDVNNDSDMCTTMRNADNGNIIESSDVDGTRNLAGGIMVQEDKETNAVDSGAIVNDNQASVCQNNSGNSEVKVEEDMSQSRSELHNEVKLHSNVEGEQPSDPLISKAVKKVDEALDSSSNINKENLSTGLSQGPQDSSMHEVPGTVLSGKDTAAGSDCQTPRVHLKVVDKAHEDSILEKARIIEERLWKLTAAAQICHRAAFTSRLRIESQHQHWELKKVAHDLAKAVNQFWVSAETLLKGDDSSSCQRDCNYDLVGSMRIDRNKTSQDKNGEPNMEPSKDLEPQHPQKDLALSVREYAVRFLKYNKSLGPDRQAQAPATPERISDLGITEMSWEDHLTEENLFYAVPSGAMETYRKLIESHLVQFEGSAYDQGWQLDSAILNEQRDHSKKRSEGHHYESNGTIGLYGQHTAKKPKILKQSLDNTYDSITPMPGSNPSPVASQMSNMSNTSKFIKLIGGRDRGRKTKSLKMSTGQPGSGGPWSLFEDQALVVLVHDMGPNWEFISDAINSTLHLKCIFRKPKECKERHKILMDMNSGDGADSAEDSGSSQPYPSTIPGIPKARGSARQLFQRLQEPMEEDVLKSHFEKMINIGQKHHYRRSQNENQDPKQITTVHNSHVVALSQVSPNNLNGGVLTLVPVPSAIPQWKSSEAVYDANMPNSTAQVGPVGSPPLTNSSGNEPGPPISQGLGPRRLSGNLLSHGLNVGAQWQQQQLLQRSPSLPSPSQQHYQQQEQQQQQQEQESPQHQLPLQQQSQQQMQHLQAGQGSLYMMSGNSKPE